MKYSQLRYNLWIWCLISDVENWACKKKRFFSWGHASLNIYRLLFKSVIGYKFLTVWRKVGKYGFDFVTYFKTVWQKCYIPVISFSRNQFVLYAECGNFGNLLLSQIFGKNFVKEITRDDLTKHFFDKSKFLILPHCGTITVW